MYLYFSIGIASAGNQHCANCIGTRSLPLQVTWEVAGRDCRRHGAHLLTVRSSVEQRQLAELARTNSGTRQISHSHTLQWRIQGGVQGVQTPALLFRCPFLKRTILKTCRYGFSCTACFVNTKREL